ncbi:MAG: hypothetical protein N2Z70_02685 [Bdellovibrionaceae bacterium]|jgi:hypothetical protein|nr:hypothetical protein [Pseudobdellovibrionaceae bacterium]
MSTNNNKNKKNDKKINWASKSDFAYSLLLPLSLISSISHATKDLEATISNQGPYLRASCVSQADTKVQDSSMYLKAKVTMVSNDEISIQFLATPILCVAKGQHVQWAKSSVFLNNEYETRDLKIQTEMKNLSIALIDLNSNLIQKKPVELNSQMTFDEALNLSIKQILSQADLKTLELQGFVDKSLELSLLGQKHIFVNGERISVEPSSWSLLFKIRFSQAGSSLQMRMILPTEKN